MIYNSTDQSDPLNILRALTHKTSVYPKAGSGSTPAMSYVVLGLLGEAGELANKSKKVLRGDYDSFTDPKVYNALLDELADCLWYLDRAAAELGQPLHFLIRRLKEKLEARQAAGTIQGEGDNR